MSDIKKHFKKNIAADELEPNTVSTTEAVAALQAEVESNLLGWQKALADYQNLQKDTEKRLDSLRAYMTTSFILELLPIFDNYYKAITHIPVSEKKSAWAVGLEHILKMWQQFLTEHEVEQIKALGEKFDPHWHEAIDKVHDDKIADQEVVKELLPGYKIKDILIRPAQVVVNNLEE